MHVVMKLISPIAKMYILIMYQFILHRCLGFSFISFQDYGRQNLAFLAKIFFAGRATWIMNYTYYFFFPEGWAIPRKELEKKSIIGKGEFGGKLPNSLGVSTLNNS